MSRLSRLYAVAESLRAAAPRLLTVAQLAQRHGVSTRTIQRDLQALMASGVPLRWEEGRGGGWTTAAEMTLPPVNLSAEEAAALLLAVTAGGHRPLSAAAHSGWGKIAAVLSGAGSAGVEHWQQRVLVSRRGADSGGDRLRPLELALQQSQALRLSYRDASGQASQRVVEPIGLLTAAGQWYLIAWCRLRQANRGFRLDRLEAAELLPEQVPFRDLASALDGEGH